MGLYDASTIATLVADQRFTQRQHVFPLEVAEHLLERASVGERDIDRLKESAFQDLLRRH
jgi:hypothetical protein